MHNLFLGTAKYGYRQLLSSDDLKVVNSFLKKVKLPVNIDHLPNHIDTGATFTAEQWKNCTMYFSIFCVHGLISDDELEFWRHFVLTCRRLCKISINVDDIKISDALLMHLC